MQLIIKTIMLPTKAKFLIHNIIYLLYSKCSSMLLQHLPHTRTVFPFALLTKNAVSSVNVSKVHKVPISGVP